MLLSHVSTYITITLHIVCRKRHNSRLHRLPPPSFPASLFDGLSYIYFLPDFPYLLDSTHLVSFPIPTLFRDYAGLRKIGFLGAFHFVLYSWGLFL